MRNKTKSKNKMRTAAMGGQGGPIGENEWTFPEGRWSGLGLQVSIEAAFLIMRTDSRITHVIKKIKTFSK